MIIIQLIYNLSVLAALSIFSGFIDKRFKRSTIVGQLLQGFLFAFAVIVGMKYPFVFGDGIIFDGRSIVISLCTLFFGPLSGIITAGFAAIYRIYLGGGGWIMGVSVITESFIIGYLFYYLRSKSEDKKISLLRLYGMGFIVHLIMVALMILLPAKNFAEAFVVVAPTVIIFYPALTVLIGKVLQDQEENEIYAKQLSESEEKYRTTFYSIGDAIITTDIQGRITDMNLTAQELTGYSLDEVRGALIERVLLLLNYNTNEKVENPVKKIFNTGKAITLENHTALISKDGKKIAIADSGAPIYDSSGKITGSVIVFRDQTEEYNARLALQKSEEKYKNLVNNSPMGILTYFLDDDDNLIFLGGNNSANDLLGINCADYIGKEIGKVFPKLKNSKIEFVYKDIAKFGGVYSDAEYFYNDGIVSGVYEFKAFQVSQNYIAVFFDDVSERYKYQQALKESEEKHRILLDESTDPIFSFSPEGVYVYVNKAFATGVGKKIEEIIGKTIWDVFPYEEAKKRITALNIVFETGEEKVIEVRVPNPGGDRFYITTITPVKDTNNKVSLVICSSKDITERKKVEDTLIENEAMMKAFMNNVPAAIMIKDSEFRPIFSNDTLKKIFPFEEWHNKTPHETYTGELADYVYNTDKEALEKGSIQYEDTWEDRYGRVRNFLTSKFRIDFPNKKPMVGAIITDITERKRNEEILNIQYNIAYAMATVKTFEEVIEVVRVELGRLVDTTNFYVALYDEKTGMLHAVNEKDEKDNLPYWPAEKSLTGYVIKNNKTMLIDNELFYKLVEEGVVDIIGEPSEIWLGVPIRINEKPIGAICVQSYEREDLYDERGAAVLEMIANQLSGYLERQMAIDNLRESEDKFRSFAELAPFAIMIYQGDYWVYTNPAGEKISGYSAEELYKMHYWDFVGENFKKLIETRGKQRQAGENVESSYEFSIISKDGKEKWVYLTGRQIKYMGKPAGFISVVDITERKMMERELLEAKLKAEEMNRVKSYFFANMSHELRTPFMPIMGYAELLASTLTDPDEKEMAEAILYSSRRLTETLKNVLDLTRLEFDKIEVVKTNTNVILLINEIFYLFKETAKKKGIELRTSYASDVVMCYTEEQFVREILTNFVSNAIKFTSVGYVEISAKNVKEDEHEYVVLCVEDTGVGIPADKQSVIWDEFRQVSEGTTRNFQGSGLGLAIVRRYAEMIDALVYVESEEGKGSKFYLKLKL
jgi:PAS domain S-box-containing protein